MLKRDQFTETRAGGGEQNPRKLFTLPLGSSLCAEIHADFVFQNLRKIIYFHIVVLVSSD